MKIDPETEISKIIDACTFFATKEKKLFTNKFLSCIILVFRRYKTKNGAKAQINGYASFLFVFQLSNNW